MNTFNTAKTEKTTNVWLTPRYVLDLPGHFDVDPCSATVRPWDCARVNYTEADNGLLLPWEGRIRFCRPDGETHGNQPNAPSCLVAWDNTEAPLLYTLQNQGLGKVAAL